MPAGERNMEITEIVMSLDFIIFLVVGGVTGWLASLVQKDSGLGENIVIGVVGSVISGFVFDWLDFMNVGDVADPVIAAVVGAVILLLFASAIRRKGTSAS